MSKINALDHVTILKHAVNQYIQQREDIIKKGDSIEKLVINRLDLDDDYMDEIDTEFGHYASEDDEHIPRWQFFMEHYQELVNDYEQQARNADMILYRATIFKYGKPLEVIKRSHEFDTMEGFATYDEAVKWAQNNANGSLKAWNDTTSVKTEMSYRIIYVPVQARNE